MNTTAASFTEKRRAQTAARKAPPPRRHHTALWPHILRGWLRRLPEWILRKASLSELVEAQVRARTEQLFRQANYDALTHLPNRAYFMQTVEQTLKSAESAEGNFALLFLDLDGFKPVNDTYGHGAGDELLRLVAARLVSSVRDYDFVSRLGGDEFVILLRDVVDQEIIETISKRLIQEVSRPYWVDGRAVHVSTSVGITEYPRDGKTVSQLMERADQALYVAKKRGRKQFCFYKDVQQLPDAAPDKLQTRFEVDVEHNKFAIHFRPIMTLRDEQCIGAHLNVQWQDAPISPAWYEDWRHLLHRSQWSVSMGLWMIDSAAWHRSRWRNVPDDFFVSVPLDMALLLEDRLDTLLLDRIGTYGVSPRHLELRIELETLYKLDQKAIQCAHALKDAGFRLRFTGVGDQSLEPHLLTRTPLEAAALSGRWIGQQLTRPDGARWIRALITLVASLEATVHVDDIPDDDQRRLLARLGAHTGEGAAWQSWVHDEAFARFLQLQFAA